MRSSQTKLDFCLVPYVRELGRGDRTGLGKTISAAARINNLFSIDKMRNWQHDHPSHWLRRIEAISRVPEPPESALGRGRKVLVLGSAITPSVGRQIDRRNAQNILFETFSRSGAHCRTPATGIAGEMALCSPAGLLYAYPPEQVVPLYFLNRLGHCHTHLDSPCPNDEGSHFEYDSHHA